MTSSLPHSLPLTPVDSRIEELQEPSGSGADDIGIAHSQSHSSSSGDGHNPFEGGGVAQSHISPPSSEHSGAGRRSRPQSSGGGSSQYHHQQESGASSPRMAFARPPNRVNGYGSGSMTPSSSWQGHTSGAGFASYQQQHQHSPALPPSHSLSPASSFGNVMSASQQNHARSVNNANASVAAPGMTLRQRKLFQSRILREDEPPHKPWLESRSRSRADRKAYWIFVIAVMLGVAGAGALIATGIISTPTYKYCLLLDEQFQGTEINKNTWFHEIETGGFGNGEFEWTTDSTNNSFVRDGSLYIVPTLTSDSLGDAAITNGYTLNLTESNTCTASNKTDMSCAVASNSTLGTVLPPIQSARLITNFSTTIKYGRVEVRAKMPTGDWIWPAVWMMPKDSVYGPWPRSGEIDIFESKGNIVKTKNDDFSNRMHSSLHWGPDAGNDRYLKTTDNRQLYRNYYNQDFHTFGLEWTPEGIYTWEDSPIHKVLSYRWKQDFWTKGQFGTTSSNGTVLKDPWPHNSRAAPFDQEFFLILSVAVGGTNSYFNEPDMPWSNNGENPRADFWRAKNDWYPTWPAKPEDRGMVVDYVKMWNMEGVAGKDCPA